MPVFALAQICMLTAAVNMTIKVFNVEGEDQNFGLEVGNMTKNIDITRFFGNFITTHVIMEKMFEHFISPENCNRKINHILFA